MPLTWSNQSGESYLEEGQAPGDDRQREDGTPIPYMRERIKARRTSMNNPKAVRFRGGGVWDTQKQETSAAGGGKKTIV